MYRALLIGTVVALAGAATAQARPGDLDETFSRDGLVTASSTDGHSALAIQADGAIVVAGGAGGGEISLTRYRPDGSLDTAFGDGGSVAYPAGPNSHASQLAIDSQGRLIAAGSVGTGSEDGDFVAARFLADGTPDTSFGDGGSVRIGFPNFEVLGGLALTADDGILLAGSGSGGTDSGAILLAQLDENGDPDASFSGDGKQLIPTTNPDNAFAGAVGDVAIAGDGSIYVAWGAYSLGQGDSRIHVLKLDAAGDPVAAYGDAGVAAAPPETDAVSSFVGSLALDSEGSAVVAGSACTGLHIYCVGRVRRFTTGGELDGSFADAGVLAQDGPLGGVIVLPDGRLLIAGYDRNHNPTRDDWSLRRLLSDGAPDPSFSDDGLVTTDFEFDNDEPNDFAIAPDGRIVLLGMASGEAGLARYEVADGPADADADGLTDDADRCPSRYSKHRTGCPRVKRRVTIEAQGDELLGRVISKLRPCNSGERVRLLRRRPGRDELVRRVRSHGDHGHWEEPMPPAFGRIYAVVKRNIEPEVGRCVSDRSKAIVVERHGRAR